MKKILFAFCLVFITLAAVALTGCAPDENAATSPTAIVVANVPTLRATSTDMLTPLLPPRESAESTSATATLTPRPTATAKPSPTASLTPSPTRIFAVPLLSPFDERLMGFSNGVLSIARSDGQMLSAKMTDQTTVTIATESQVRHGGTFYQTIHPLDALRLAVRENAPIQLGVEKGPLQAAFVVLSDADNLSALPTVISVQVMTQPTPALTPTPAGFVPTPTPVLAPRSVDMPWGKINLDLPLDQANNYAMGAWCWRGAALLDPHYLSLWATNPIGMLGHNYAVSVFNAEVLGKDADWSVDSQGRKYFNAYMIERATRSKIDTHRFVLSIYAGAPIATYIPADERLSSNGKGDGWIPGFFLVPVPVSVTDINQIRVGEIYGITGNDVEWPQPLDQIATRAVAPDSTPLIIYTVPFPWQSTCEYMRQQYLNHWQPTPTGGLGPEWDPNKP